MYISDVVLQTRTNQTMKTSGSAPSDTSTSAVESDALLSNTLSRPLVAVPAAVLDLSEYAQSILSRMSPGATHKSTPGEMSQEAKDALKDLNDKMSRSSINSESVADTKEKAELPSFTGEAIAGKGTTEDSAAKALQKKNSKAVDPEEAQKPKGANGRPLTDKEMAIVKEMQARDAHVRAHEQAHVAAGGGLTSAPSYEYQNGPDGKRYVVGGHVSINTSPGRTPEETLMKAERIRASALAPADPSPADRAVASQATQMASQARAQISVEKQHEAQAVMEKLKDNSELDETSPSTSDPVGTAKPAFSAAETALEGTQSAADTADAIEDRQSGIEFSSNTTKKFLRNLGVVNDFGVQKFKGIKGIEAFKPDKPRIVGSGSQVLKAPAAVGSYNAMSVVLNASALKD